MGWPSGAWLERVKREQIFGKYHSFADLALEDRHAAQLARRLREWSTGILGMYPEDERSDVQHCLQGFINRLDNTSSKVRGGDNQRQISRREKKRKALHCYFAGSRLRSRNSLKTVLVHSAAALDGKKWKLDGLRKNLTSALGTAATGWGISRLQLPLDICLCRFVASDLSSADGPIYLWADSSPKAGTDWLLSTMMWVRQGQLAQVFEAYRFMALTSDVLDVPRDADDAVDNRELEDIAAERDLKATFLADTLHIHKQVPLGLGSAQGSVDHKLRALAQKCLVECTSLDGVRLLLGRVRSLCVDMGTELSMADAGGIALEDVLPPWMTAAAGHGLHADEEPMGGQDVEACDDHIMCRTLLVPGTCHILHNLQHDVDSCLQGWEQKPAEHTARFNFLIEKEIIPCCKIGTLPRRFL